MSKPDRYRMRAPASGREAIVAVEGPSPREDVGFYDQVTGERMEVVSRLLPNSESQSSLARSQENMRICPRCRQLVEQDLSECPFCARSLPALNPSA